MVAKFDIVFYYWVFMPFRKIFETDHIRYANKFYD